MTVVVFLVVVLVLIRLWNDVGSLRENLRLVNGQLDEERQTVTVALQELATRLSQLEGGHLTVPAAVAAAPIAPPVTPPIVKAPAPVAVMPPVVVLTPSTERRPIPASLSTFEPLAAAATTGGTAVSPAPVPAVVDEAWEVVVGTNWLNKLGAVVLVIGIALLLGYSMTHVGPFGRVAIGFATSAAMLGTGVTLERRDAYRTYAYALIGGGWAGIYFTAYAMHAVPAARILTSEVDGALVLIAVAAGMVVHSLRYRSETVSGLAYVAAYAPLTFTSLTTFSLVAAIPLTASLLLVAERYQWTRIIVLGVASTYGIFVLRLTVLPGGGLTPDGLVYAVLWTYWLLFEGADLWQRLDGRRSADGEPLFALNAVGSLGTLLLQTRLEADQWIVMSVAAVAYAASAGIRAVIARHRSDDEAPAPAFGTTHAAIALSAGLLALSIGLRMTGSRQTLAWLLETELLVAAGLGLRDPYVRRIGAAFAGLVTGYVVVLLSLPEAAGGYDAASLVAALVAVAWWANDAWLRRRGTSDPIEMLYPWIALGFALAVNVREVPGVYQGLVALAVSVVMFEVAVRRDVAARARALVAFAIGIVLVLGEFLIPYLGRVSTVPAHIVWTILPLTVALAYGFALRASAHARAGHKEVAWAAAAGTWCATGLLALFEWHAAAPAFVAPVWAASGLGLAILGRSRQVALVRSTGYALSSLGAARAALPLFERVVPVDMLTSAAVVVATLYALAYVSRAFLSAKYDPDNVEAVAALVLQAIPTYVLLILAWRALPAVPAIASWTAVAAMLLAAGLRGAADLRWQAYAVFGLSALGLFVQVTLPADLNPAEIAVTSLGLALLYAASATRLLSPRDGSEDDRVSRRIETACQSGLSISATVLLSFLLLDVLSTSLVTLAWGIQGAALLLIGFAVRDRVLRLSGLAMLLFCIAKLFVYDLRELEALARIFSFVVLGVLLLAVSWVYTRHRDELRRIL